MSATANARKSARLSEAARLVFARRLEDLLIERGLSRRHVAAESGIALGTVCQLLRGVGEPTLGTMLALVRVLELSSIEELIAPFGTRSLLSDDTLLAEAS